MKNSLVLLLLQWAAAPAAASAARTKDLPYDYALDHPVSAQTPTIIVPFVKNGKEMFNRPWNHDNSESLNMNSVPPYKDTAMLLDAAETQEDNEPVKISAPTLRSLPYGMETANAIGETAFIEMGASTHLHRNMWREQKHNAPAPHQKAVPSSNKPDPFYAKYTIKEQQKTIDEAPSLIDVSAQAQKIDLKNMLNSQSKGGAVPTAHPPPSAFGLDAFNKQARQTFAPPLIAARPPPPQQQRPQPPQQLPARQSAPPAQQSPMRFQQVQQMQPQPGQPVYQQPMRFQQVQQQPPLQQSAQQQIAGALQQNVMQNQIQRVLQPIIIQAPPQQQPRFMQPQQPQIIVLQQPAMQPRFMQQQPMQQQPMQQQPMQQQPMQQQPMQQQQIPLQQQQQMQFAQVPQQQALQPVANEVPQNFVGSAFANAAAQLNTAPPPRATPPTATSSAPLPRFQQATHAKFSTPFSTTPQPLPPMRQTNAFRLPPGPAPPLPSFKTFPAAGAAASPPSPPSAAASTMRFKEQRTDLQQETTQRAKMLNNEMIDVRSEGFHPPAGSLDVVQTPMGRRIGFGQPPPASATDNNGMRFRGSAAPPATPMFNVPNGGGGAGGNMGPQTIMPPTSPPPPALIDNPPLPASLTMRAPQVPVMRGKFGEGH